jgi:hypothetical protein
MAQFFVTLCIVTSNNSINKKNNTTHIGPNYGQAQRRIGPSPMHLLAPNDDTKKLVDDRLATQLAIWGTKNPPITTTTTMMMILHYRNHRQLPRRRRKRRHPNQNKQRSQEESQHAVGGVKTLVAPKHPADELQRNAKNQQLPSSSKRIMIIMMRLGREAKQYLGIFICWLERVIRKAIIGIYHRDITGIHQNTVFQWMPVMS